MPYSKISELPPSTKGLSLNQKRKFMEVFNALVADGIEEDAAFPIAMKESKRKKHLSKSSSKEIVTKAVGDSFANEDEMVSYEIVMLPNVFDAHGEWSSAETIRKAQENFEQNKKANNITPNLYHMFDTDMYDIEKTWINEELDVLVEETSQHIPKDAWVAKVRYFNEDLWTLKKAGIIQGLSIQCSGRVNKETGEITEISFDPEE